MGLTERSFSFGGHEWRDLRKTGSRPFREGMHDVMALDQINLDFRTRAVAPLLVGGNRGSPQGVAERDSGERRSTIPARVRVAPAACTLVAQVPQASMSGIYHHLRLVCIGPSALQVLCSYVPTVDLE